MENETNQNWFKELFIDEAKHALVRYNGTCSDNHDTKTYINAEEVEY